MLIATVTRLGLTPTMIFEVSPANIEALDSKELVQLLRRLLYAEAQRAGISLRGVSVPLQIAVSDGGEDARIGWEGGQDHTDYFPARFSIFQSKASDPGPSGWKQEVWKKNSWRQGSAPKLNDAVEKALAQRGAYIGFTSDAIIGPRYDRRVAAIKAGIQEAGGDPADLTAVDIYDANKIAAWTSAHPGVALWLHEKQSSVSLGGFTTMGGWAGSIEISSTGHVEDNAARYVIGGEELIDQHERRTLDKNALDFHQSRERISDHLAEARNSVRIMGPSGVGKTRFGYEVLKEGSTLNKSINSISAIYCSFQSVGESLMQLAERLAQLGSPTLIVVDECSREVAAQLTNIARRKDSQLRFLTIGIDDRPIKAEACLNILVTPGDDQLIHGIVRQKLPNANDTEVSYIKNLCGGFPRIAVLATAAYSVNMPVLRSIGDVVDRILLGAGIQDRDQVKAIECLALFDRLGADEECFETFDFVAEKIGGMPGNQMYEYLALASNHQLVERRGRFFVAQPLPIAAFLGVRRLDLMRVTTVLDFVERAEPQLVLSFFKQWRHFDLSRTARRVAEHLLSPLGKFGSFESLTSDLGAECLHHLVDVSADLAADTLARVFGTLTLEDLKQVRTARRQLVWALEKLVFRDETFPIAARLLLHFGAAENEAWANNARSQFTQLFNLHLSGTQASPPERFAVLDEGLSSGDQNVIGVCVDALKHTLNRQHFIRSGGAEQIGSGPPLRDWEPHTWSDVFDFHRSGLRRLLSLRSDALWTDRCDAIIASHVRGLLCENLFEDIEAATLEIARQKGLWLEIIQAIGDWLYFDRSKAPVDLSARVRALYDRLLPTGALERALLYSKFYPASIRDPDVDYQRETDAARDFEYASRKAREIAKEIAADDYLTEHSGIQP